MFVRCAVHETLSRAHRMGPLQGIPGGMPDPFQIKHEASHALPSDTYWRASLFCWQLLAVAFRKTFKSCCTFYLQWPPCKAKQKNVCRSSHPVVRRSMLLSAVQELLNAKLTRHEAKLERFVKLTHAEQAEDGVSTGGLGERQGCLTYREMQWAQAYETQRRPSLVCP